jgi:hypothetical protein
LTPGSKARRRGKTLAWLVVGREMLHCRKCVDPGMKSLWEFHQAVIPRGLRRGTMDVVPPSALSVETAIRSRQSPELSCDIPTP